MAAFLIYGKNLKNLLLQNRVCLVAAQIIRDGRPIIAKMMVVQRHLTFFTARSSLLLYAFVWVSYICMEKMFIISYDFL